MSTLRADSAAAEFLAIATDSRQRCRGDRRAWQEATAARPGHRLGDEDALTTTLLFLRRDEGAAGALEGIRLLIDMFPESGDRA